jgi:transposase
LHAPARRGRAAIYDGASRTEAARIGDVTLRIVRNWVLRSNADARMACAIARHRASRRG